MVDRQDIKLHPSSDGLIRVVDIRPATTQLGRPVVKLVKLPVDHVVHQLIGFLRDGRRFLEVNCALCVFVLVKLMSYQRVRLLFGLTILVLG